jgi:tetratricopeptide (TPR) repeat protein
MARLTRTLAAFAFAGMAVFSGARADELQDIGQLIKSGQHAQALERVNRYLASKPKDAQGRFLKGLIFAEQNKTADAIDVFTKLSQDYPELPEPYNNVAVLHASQGQYEKARQALEMSIRTHPAYATAYENLGDVYAKLASQSYDKALQLDSSNAGAKSKLALMTELISNGSARPRTQAPAPSQPTRTADAGKSAAAPAAPAAPQATPEPPAQPKPQAQPKPPAKPAPAKPDAADSASEDVLKSVHGWARAWSSKDLPAYLGYYAPDFRTPGGEARGKWEAGRRQRISGPKKIEVEIDSPRVAMNGAGSATVTFRQNYRSDSLKTSSTKTLVMTRNGGKWQIQQERVGR